ncbi:hypothetical protein OG402_41130 [Streptomyces anulatus]|uniref:hypothetical protein n=1 Tax=Streptomyces anulatus TaxID=1892 RepID=UPI00225ABB6E|nr:hypothetical protein [Streptomyces anulatus]MCX4606833.1 hypothetical protein [Streptomyces anulatus]WSI82932.1 hypothetical protein OG557_39215 [Streptomyces anulatus]
MRRPALNHPNRADTSAWARPYSTGPFSPVFYASGDPAEPPAVDPATDPTPVPGPPKPKPPVPAADRPGLQDGELVVHKDWLEQKLTVEKDAGRRNGNQRLAADLGFDDVKAMRAYVEEKRQTDQAQLSETERRAQELEERERQIATREAQAAARELAANRKSLLAGLGAAGADLEDATALLRVDNDATDDELRAAAEALKERRPELFGARSTPAPGATPPAPTGLPANGVPRPGANQPKPGERGLAMLARRGKIPASQ